MTRTAQVRHRYCATPPPPPNGPLPKGRVGPGPPCRKSAQEWSYRQSASMEEGTHPLRDVIRELTITTGISSSTLVFSGRQTSDAKHLRSSPPSSLVWRAANHTERTKGRLCVSCRSWSRCGVRTPDRRVRQEARRGGARD